MARRSFQRHIEVHPRADLLKLGSEGYGFWVVPADLLGPSSICYLAGVGEDISFDLALIARFGCDVDAFDPVPASRVYAEEAAKDEPRFTFHPVGLWSADGTLDFHAPSDPTFISHSATNIHGTDPRFQAPVRSVSSLMREFGHPRIDLLKLSVEGSEYTILESLATDDLDISIVCVEFAQPPPSGAPEAAFDGMVARGYRLVSADVSGRGMKVTFVRDEHGSAPSDG